METAPPPAAAAPPTPPDWAFGMFSCLDDIGLCCITYFVPCLTFGQLAEKLGEDCMPYGLALLVPLLNIYCLITVRGRVREKFGIEGSMVKDFLAFCCCPICALVQSARQVKLEPGEAIPRV